MPKLKIRNFHRNRKLAFLDGILCGIVVVYYGRLIYQQIQEEKIERESAKEFETATQDVPKN